MLCLMSGIKIHVVHLGWFRLLRVIAGIVFFTTAANAALFEGI